MSVNVFLEGSFHRENSNWASFILSIPQLFYPPVLHSSLCWYE